MTNLLKKPRHRWPGKYLLTGPEWQGDAPADISGVIPSETSIIFIVVRTQLFNPQDLGRVKELQQAFKVQPLGACAGTPSPPTAPVIAFPDWVEGSQFDGRALNYVDFMMGLTGRHPSEAALYERFSKIGLGTNGGFDIDQVSPETREAIEAGVKDGFTELEALIAKLIADPISSAKVLGTREFLMQTAKDFGFEDYWLLRMDLSTWYCVCTAQKRKCLLVSGGIHR